MKKPSHTAAMRITPPACRLVYAAMAPTERLAIIGRSHRLEWVRNIMTVEGFTVFPTAIGHCGLAWAEQGIIGAQLPEGREPQTRARMRRRFPGLSETKPPVAVRHVADQIVSLLDGGDPDLSSVELDMTGVPDFDRRVYDVVRTIPPGETLTYGDIARRIGLPGSAQAVGQAMGRNPFAPIVPCHRVLAAGGKDGGFSAYGGISTKRRILVIEGALADEPTLF
jgi:methylated-DNA-[protein]-cysteine S-methyltransferase